MLQLNIDRVCKARSIRKPFAFLIKAGFANSTAHQIANGDVSSLKLEHLEKLCLVLNCTPHDLLEWTPREGQPTNIPMATLIPEKESGLEWVQTLKDLPLSKLRELGEVLKNTL